MLKYLLDKLESLSIDYLLLGNKDNDLPLSLPAERLTKIESSNLLKREKVIKRWVDFFTVTSILCFGNFGTLSRHDVPVYVYFHNPHLLELKSDEPLYKKIYLTIGLRSVTKYFFQTEVVRDKFCRAYKFPRQKTELMPFYDTRNLKPKASSSKLSEAVFVYNSLPYKHKNYENLLKAWVFLAEENFFPKLYVTTPQKFLGQVCELPKLDNIINLGFVTHGEILDVMRSSTHCIFPSLKESFGLGLIESAELGLQVIASDLPYVYQVIEPSAVFDPLDYRSIAGTVKSIVEGKKFPPTRLKVRNEIDGFISRVTT